MAVCLTFGAMPALAQESPEPASDGPVPVTSTQACTWALSGGVPTGTCTRTASDPRVAGPMTMTMAEAVGVPGGDDYLQTFDVLLEGPEGTWTGSVWVLFDPPTKTGMRCRPWPVTALTRAGRTSTP